MVIPVPYRLYPVQQKGLGLIFPDRGVSCHCSEKSVTMTPVGLFYTDNRPTGHEVYLIEMLAELACLGVAQEDGVTESEFFGTRIFNRRLHLPGSFL